MLQLVVERNWRQFGGQYPNKGNYYYRNVFQENEKSNLGTFEQCTIYLLL